MILSEFEQGTDEWMSERVGIPTASNFDKIVTSKGGKSTQSAAFMNTLLGEWATGLKASVKQTEWMERGVMLEEEARVAYEFLTNSHVKQVGLCFKDESKNVGASPDGLLETKGLEIKCPAPGTHISYLLNQKLPSKYVAQVQGSMWVTGKDEWDFCSYHPDIKPLVITIQADIEMQKKIDEIINEFINEMLLKRQQIVNLL